MDSYDPQLVHEKDKVRFLIGDVSLPFDLADTEIEWLLTTFGGSVFQSAQAALTNLIAKYSKTSGTKTIGPFSISQGEKVDKYERALSNLRASEAMLLTSVVPFASGWDNAAKEAREQDTNRESTFAHKGDHDNEASYIDYQREQFR